MMSERKKDGPDLKAKISLEALTGERTLAELWSRFSLHPTMIHSWKNALLEGASGMFERRDTKASEIDEEQAKELHADVGELAVAKCFFVKKA